MASPGIGAEEFPCDILGPLAYEEDVVAEKLEFREGAVRASGRPGLGVEIDEGKLERYRRK